VALIHALFMLLGVGLTAGMLLLITLCVLLGFLLILRRVHAAPAATTVRLLPARSGVFVNISVMAGIHVTAGVLGDSGVPVR